MQVIQHIQHKIYEIRGERVILDFDLASLYEVETKVLNLAVKRNIQRFPEDFMFQLTKEEFDSLRFQFETLKTGRGQHRKYLPYAFTEQGVAMLSGILKSDKAIAMNIAIMRAFVEIRRIAFQQVGFHEQLKQIKERLSEHDVQLNHIYDAMEDLLDKSIDQTKWEERERIGFK